jgi:hypothetical protein
VVQPRAAAPDRQRTGRPELPDCRIHGDLQCGDFCLFGYGEEYVDAPGVLKCKVEWLEARS